MEIGEVESGRGLGSERLESGSLRLESGEL